MRDFIGWAILGVVAGFGVYGANKLVTHRRAERRAAIRDLEMLEAIAELHALEELDLKPWQPMWGRRMQLIEYVEGHTLEVPR